MNRLLPMAMLALATLAQPGAGLAQEPARQCWLDAMSDAEKRELVLGYARIQRDEGKARATAWAEGQKNSYEQRAIAAGQCPSAQSAAGRPADSAGGQQQDQQPLNRFGKPCKRIELENQNVPNIGGSMGWALLPVCKD